MLTVTLPISKSIANRLQILYALQGKTMPLPDDCCEDIRVLHDAIELILGTGSDTPLNIDIGDCGTAMRFLTAYLASQQGRQVVLTGSKRMQERPIGGLVDALRSIGAKIEYMGNEGYPPLRIVGRRLDLNTPVSIDTTQSTQFVSAMMLITSPTDPRGTTSPPAPPPEGGESSPLNPSQEGVENPYISMTREVIRRFADSHAGDGSADLDEGVSIEHDWSAAAFWYEYVALWGGEVLLKDLHFDSLQGDRQVADIFAKYFGVLSKETEAGVVIKGVSGQQSGVRSQESGVRKRRMASAGNGRNFDCGLTIDGSTGGKSHKSRTFSETESGMPRPTALDCSGFPDLVPVIAVTARELNICLPLTGTDRLRLKESDRLAALKENFERTRKGLTVRSHSDHRIAMAFIMAGYRVDDTQCISKSYPLFMQQVNHITFVIPFRHGTQTSEAFLVPEQANKTSEANGTTEHVLYIDDLAEGKKAALRKGVSAAATEYVWLSDIDVSRNRYPYLLPQLFTSAGEEGVAENADLYILPLKMEGGRSLLERLQKTEYEALQNLTIRTAQQGRAVMCSGANLLVRRQLWLEIAAADELHDDIPSGDDMFLLEAVKRRGGRIATLTDRRLVASVKAETSLKRLLLQRMRWAGKAPHYTDRDIRRCGVAVVVANLLCIICPPLYIVKYLLERRFLSCDSWTAVLLSFVYPWYMLICLVGGLLRRRKW